jgi:transposase
MIKYSEEFKQEAVRIALTSGLPRARVASDLGVGKSTLGKWVTEYRPTDLVAALQADLAHENERLRLENRILKEEREILKNCPRLSPPVCGRNGLWYEGVRRVSAVRLLVA